MSTEPKTLLWDLETTHNIVATFRLHGEDYIPHENVLQERYIVCAAWKWLGEKTVHAVSTLDDKKRFARNPHDDRHVVETLHATLSQADVVVAHNGDKYDTKFFLGRAIMHGLPPLPPFTSIDTYKIAKRFLFNSNRLDYIARYLGGTGKKDTTRGLWLRVLKGEPAAIREMVAYNKVDVAELERVFMRLRPYMPNYFNRELMGLTGCPRCGSGKVQSRGTHKALTRTYNRFQCRECGGWFRKMRPETRSTSHRVIA
jgi:hypothetical protein